MRSANVLQSWVVFTGRSGRVRCMRFIGRHDATRSGLYRCGIVRYRARPPTLIAIPVCNEAERIGACLAGLAAQDEPGPASVLLFLNNCTDETAAIAAGWRGDGRLRLRLEDVSLPPDLASAGMARSMAMRQAASIAAQAGLDDYVLLTSDADSVAPPGWVRANLDAIAAGADAVCGRAVIDPTDAALIPPRLHDDDRRECAYGTMLDEIAWLLDPDPADPWPRHTENSGASIAVTGAAHAAAGGVPAIGSGEDRAFVAALRRIDARVRHAREVEVTVSGRIVGRAQGGMADTIRRRLLAPDPFLDDRLECVADAVRRARLRQRLRGIHARRHAATLGPELVSSLGIDRQHLASLLDAPHFGMAWESIEAASPALRRAPVPAGWLAPETTRARAVLRQLRRLAHPAQQEIEPVAGIVIDPAVLPGPAAIPAARQHPGDKQIGRGIARKDGAGSAAPVRQNDQSILGQPFARQPGATGDIRGG